MPCSASYKIKWTEKGQAQRQQTLKSKYGIGIFEFQTMLLQQDSKCAICSIEMILPLKRRGQPLNSVCVDHDHITGNVRELLCSRCNKGLGFFDDDIELLRKSIDYLEKHKKCQIVNLLPHEELEK